MAERLDELGGIIDASGTIGQTLTAITDRIQQDRSLSGTSWGYHPHTV